MTTYTNIPHTQHEPSLGDLFSDLSANASTLVRKEVALAKAEMSEKAKQAGQELALLAVAAFLGNAALLALVSGFILIMGLWIPLWAAALIMGVALALVAGGLAWTGVQALKRINPAPTETIQTLQEDKEWLSAQMS